MTYATRTDLEERYGTDEVTQRESMLPAGAVARALADADAEVDSYLIGRYALPLAAVPANIVRLAAAIARYRLLGDAGTDQARADYEDAVAWLKRVQDGRAQLDGLAAVSGADPAATVQIESPDRIFARGVRGL